MSLSNLMEFKKEVLRPDLINLDRNDYGQEVVRDVLRGLPFADNTFDEIWSSNFMEHIPAGDDLFFVLAETWRVAKPNAAITIIVPASDTPQAFFPDHLSFWNEAMVAALCYDGYQQSKIHKYKFELVKTYRDKSIVSYELTIILKVIK